MSKPSVYELARTRGKPAFDEFAPKAEQRTSEEKVAQAAEGFKRLMDVDAFVKENFDPHSDAQRETLYDDIWDTLLEIHNVTISEQSLAWTRDDLVMEMNVFLELAVQQVPVAYPGNLVPKPTVPISWVVANLERLYVKYALLCSYYPEIGELLFDLAAKTSVNYRETNPFKMVVNYLTKNWPGGVWPNPLAGDAPSPDPGPGPGPTPGPPEDITFHMYNGGPPSAPYDAGWPCTFCYGLSPQVTEADYYDGNIDNGGHIDGPNYPIVAQFVFGTPGLVSNVAIAHPPIGWSPVGSGLTSQPPNWIRSGEVWGLVEREVGPSEWALLGTIANGSGGGSAQRFVVVQFATMEMLSELRIVCLQNDNPAAGWFPSEFGFNVETE